jgi:hypothetical protein
MPCTISSRRESSIEMATVLQGKLTCVLSNQKPLSHVDVVDMARVAER